MVGAQEYEEENAMRELNEELGIEEPDPRFLFKFKFSDKSANAFVYCFYMLYNGRIKP